MIIPEPKLIFSNSKSAFQEYAKRYNEGQESAEQLKSPHFAQFYTYLRLSQRNMAQSNMKAINKEGRHSMAINTDFLPHLYTNNSEMRKQMDGGVPSTFLRRFERLDKAGVIRKIKHGPVKNYEIIINPHLLFIIDEKGSKSRNKINIELAQKWGSEWDSDNSKSANCIENIVSFKEHLNKEIIHQSESGNPDILPLETKKDTQKDTTGNLINLRANEKKIAAKKRKNPESFADATIETINYKLNLAKAKNEANNGPAADKMREKYGFSNKKANKNHTYHEKIKQKEAEMKTMRLQYAVMMVQMMIDYLLPGIKVFKGEKDRTISYVAENYFDYCLTFAGIQRTWAGYAERLQKARYFKKYHPGYTPFPYYYFNKENPKGFESPDWRRKGLEFAKLKRWQSAQIKLQSSLRRIKKIPDENTYQREIQYVKDNIPDLLTAFFSNIYTDYPQLTKKTA